MGGRRNLGFTLLEVMIVVAIIAILAAVAIPGYDYQVRKGHRSEAQTFMVELATKQQQYLLDARNYAVGSAALSQLGYASLPTNIATYYDVALETATGGTTAELPPTFRIRATPRVGTKQESDGELILRHDGYKSRGGTEGW